ncbi:ABC transporter permease [Sporosarcina psychrophila]|uniref:ABC transporter permease n=1 Tax=Sporosarcina psychrophila TaxID=1476 RepID=UPI00078DE9FC|nr:ABC transporter permease [Sporosarcina psychrophila]AMQ07804.1 peptide ABC transporter [Sporosarcina psychrophila]
MKEFLVKRILHMIPVLLGLSILIFGLSRIMPGDSIRLKLGPEATPQQIEQMQDSLGLNDPVPIQYINYIKGVFQGDMGQSLQTDRNVAIDIFETFPATFELILIAMGISIVIGVPLGVISAIRKDKWEDHATRVVALSGIALPKFWVAIMLQIVFAYWFSLLPVVGRGDIVPTTITGMRLLDSLLTLNFEAFFDSLKHIILPSISLSIATTAQIMRLTRSNMLAQLNKDYILAARSYGLPKGMIVYKYMLKNAFASTLTIIGLSFGALLGNAFLVEAVFGWPGMAQYGVQGVIYKDYNAIVGVTLVIGVAFAIANLIVDILYGILDPRIKYDS